ncbi:MAG: hypothetical protein Q9225_003119 [Loekoesia sp. 1 TL-2023]
MGSQEDSAVMPDPRVSFVDLLIIGAGPAGLMAAAWASQYNMSTRIIDKNQAPTAKGQADGLQARTLEIFDSFSVVDRVWKEGFHDIELNTWLGEGSEGIRRSQRVLSQKRGISRFSQTCVNQAIIEETFNGYLHTQGRLHVERNVLPETLKLDQDLTEEATAYPITMTVRHLQPATASQTNGGASRTHFGNELEWDAGVQKDKSGRVTERTEQVKAKYLLACDGAHSWTRRQVGLPMEGEQTDFVWGVMDTIPLSNFRELPTLS